MKNLSSVYYSHCHLNCDINFKIYLSKRQYIGEERVGTYCNSAGTQYFLLLLSLLNQTLSVKYTNIKPSISGAHFCANNANCFKLDSRYPAPFRRRCESHVVYFIHSISHSKMFFMHFIKS